MSIATNREDGGRLVRRAWLYWARKQSHPQASWLLTWEDLAESDKEADRVIWDNIVAPYTTLLDDMNRKTWALQQDMDLLKVILIALCVDAQTPLHMEQEELARATRAALDITHDAEGGLLISVIE